MSKSPNSKRLTFVHSDAYEVARDLREAAELVLARWTCGDLAEAVRGLDFAVDEAKAAGL